MSDTSDPRPGVGLPGPRPGERADRGDERTASSAEHAATAEQTTIAERARAVEALDLDRRAEALAEIVRDLSDTLDASDRITLTSEENR
ncbi:uncharacterized protein YceH (UPF0502 family) [Mycetocola sp. BIGb0189]|uniref:hypothetical protein n=1 Tax=Mycetocola sp. BIGb0189 TaxID=2940604 RepID=UPI0021672F49|nr:hypothetical protein [Mycetocola sp. BIGb0189]MCS4274847.1 uncharacterized protein YceH (UPF0502 family) [Mycetocola sp. BIGb0189]